jgi:hypothetical protein
MMPIAMIDVTGLYTAEEVAHTLSERGVVLAAAGPQTEWRLWADSRKRASQDRKIPIYPTMKAAMRSFHEAKVG